jgi:hypothetical protein
MTHHDGIDVDVVSSIDPSMTTNNDTVTMSSKDPTAAAAAAAAAAAIPTDSSSCHYGIQMMSHHHHDEEDKVKHLSDRTAITESSRTESLLVVGVDDEEEEESPSPVINPTAFGGDAAAADNNMKSSIDTDDYDKMKMIHPPISTSEQYRDIILRTLDLPIFQYIGIIIILGVIIDGAIFFFLLIGAHTLCHPVTDCEPRNTVYNISVQILNGFFTYMAILSLPWRLSNFLHLSPTFRRCLCCCCCCCCRGGYPQRSNEIGHNLYGLADTDIWFHIPVQQRYYITTFLLFNCLFQFINHGTRIVYGTFEQQDVHPGNIWTNVFFVSAFVCAGIGAAWIMYETSLLRQKYPTKFGHGPIDAIRHWYRCHFLKWIQEHVVVPKRNTVTNQRMKKNETNILDENSDVEIINEKIGETDYDEIEVAFHHRERITASTGGGSWNEQQQKQQQQQQQQYEANDDPTRANNHPAILLEDRGPMRMFGM